MQLWVKDNSILNHIFPQLILLHSCGKTCNEFFNSIQPCNLYLEENKKQKFQIERYIRKMCKFNVSVDAIVERIEDENKNCSPVLRLIDCKLVYN